MTIRLWYSKGASGEWYYDHGKGSNVRHTVQQVKLGCAIGFTNTRFNQPEGAPADAWIEFPDVAAFRVDGLLELTTMVERHGP